MEFVQINTKINRYPVILFQHNTYEIYLLTYALIFRKNFPHLKWIFTILILKTFLWIIGLKSQVLVFILSGRLRQVFTVHFKAVLKGHIKNSGSLASDNFVSVGKTASDFFQRCICLYVCAHILIYF